MGAQETVFRSCSTQRVALEGMVLKPNMVVPGKKAANRAGPEEVAEKTVRVARLVPAAVPGIAFLSGGQSDEEATAHLDAMNKSAPLPWTLTFSYGRALQARAQDLGRQQGQLRGRAEGLRQARPAERPRRRRQLQRRDGERGGLSRRVARARVANSVTDAAPAAAQAADTVIDVRDVYYEIGGRPIFAGLTPHGAPRAHHGNHGALAARARRRCCA